LACSVSWLESQWQGRSLACRLLWPVSVFYRTVLRIRRALYQRGWIVASSVSLPVVVVGNLSVGGTGKTPLCGYLVSQFLKAGWQPAIVSRGYGGEKHLSPHLVSNSDVASCVGDEPLMLFHQTGVPVCVCVDRAAAVNEIARVTNADIVISDDGLQHLKMQRHAEVLVVDGARGFGNSWVLPAGPLRDGIDSLSQIDMVAVQVPSGNPLLIDDELDHELNEQTVIPSHSATSDCRETKTIGMPLHESLSRYSDRDGLEAIKSSHFLLKPTLAVELRTGKQLTLAQLAGRRVHAVAGIGHPKRFFDSLTNQGMDVVEHPLADHAAISVSNVMFDDDLPVLVTAKDAIKLNDAQSIPVGVYRIDTEVVISPTLDSAIEQLIAKLDNERNAVSSSCV